MNNISRIIFVSALLGFFTTICGQASFEAPALPHSGYLSGQGGTGVSVLTYDPFAFTMNPAQLGAWSRINNIATQFYSTKTNLYGLPDITVDNQVAAFGLNFKNVLPLLDISVGLGYVNSASKRVIRYGLQGWGAPNLSSTMTDKYKAYAIGIGFHSYVDLSFGFSWKHGTLYHPDDQEYLKYADGDITADLYDFGALLNAPLHRYIFPEQINIGPGSYNPFLNVGLGLTRQNQGDNIYLGVSEGYTPVPQLAALGYSINFSTDAVFNNQQIKLFSITWTTEAASDLCDYTAYYRDGSISYAGGLGGISVIRNLIERKGDDAIICRRGFGVELGGAFTLSRGSFSRKGNFNKTYGFSIMGSGLAELVNCVIKSPGLAYIARHFDIQFHQGTQRFEHLPATNINCLVFLVRGFTFDHGFNISK